MLRRRALGTAALAAAVLLGGGVLALAADRPGPGG
ncbi:MAG: hypothetical protein JWN08_1901, partial [Frankiales bacterium]|nr:hypothetical protein [Frankiales bacterium]